MPWTLTLRAVSAPRFLSTPETRNSKLNTFKTRVTPCQFGGTPDCSQCGCIASVGLAAVGDVKVLGPITAGGLFHISNRIGHAVGRAS